MEKKEQISVEEKEFNEKIIKELEKKVKKLLK